VNTTHSKHDVTVCNKTVLMDTPEILLFISGYSMNYGMYYILSESYETQLSTGILLKSLASIVQKILQFWV